MSNPIYDGPTENALQEGEHVLCVWEEGKQHTFWDDHLTGEEIDLICGTYEVATAIRVKAMQPERITIEVPEALDEVPSVGTVAVTQGGTRKGYTVLGSVMGLQRSFRQRSLQAIWVSLRSAKKKEVPERQCNRPRGQRPQGG
ncbi:hypothetical protein DFH05DRAFT_1518492 [Lentinula detonsa]|uniref:Uncharacterized protein n=1 Tax=Lentinula detonsa TaxID=2804962 RepID=A0A9W8PAK5_9AGAR|nr:hypothetical protein DFH05DRAFT_1518492 [Lentinula detonsa]